MLGSQHPSTSQTLSGKDWGNTEFMQMQVTYHNLQIRKVLSYIPAFALSTHCWTPYRGNDPVDMEWNQRMARARISVGKELC